MLTTKENGIKNIVLIGGAGFLGTSLVQAFYNIYDITVIDTKTRLEQNKHLLVNVKVFEMNFPAIDNELLGKVFKKTEVVIHLACTTNPAKSMKDMSYDIITNVIPSIELFKLAIKHKVPKVIFSSSGGTVYGESNKPILTEKTEKKPLSAYGISKHSIEKYLSLITNGTNTIGISLRIGNPYGDFQLCGTKVGAIAAFLTAFSEKKPIIIWGDGEIIRDYLYIKDLTKAFESTIESNTIKQGCYNVGSGQGYSLNEILTIIEKVAGFKTEIRYEKTRGFDVPSIVLCTERFKSLTGWRCEYNLQDGISDMWLKINNCGDK